MYVALQRFIDLAHLALSAHLYFRVMKENETFLFLSRKDLLTFQGTDSPHLKVVQFKLFISRMV